ncbi:MAG: transglycosylase domain-containing protein [Cyanobium sp.]
MTLLGRPFRGLFRRKADSDPADASERRAGFRRTWLLPALTATAIGGGVSLGQVALVALMDSQLPDASRISSFSRPGTLTVIDTNGKVVVKQGPATRDKLPPGRVPLLIQRAFVAAEDRRFYQHDGVDLVGISRAVVRNLSQGSVEEGASTITQQLARTVFLSQDRTLLRKIKEALLAGKIERQLSKAQILEQYVNYVYLGSSAYGVADAAWVYFSKTPETLTLPEAAMIAGMPPAPSVYSPLVNPDLALQRRAVVLKRMREAGYIDEAQLARAEAAPLGLKPAEPKYFDNPAPWFTSWLEQELPGVLSKEQLEVGGLTVRSGLNKEWQIQAQQAVNAGAGSMQGALVSIEPGTGLVRAMVGGKDWQKSQFNRATQALRSPGSTFKLFAYAAALKYGMKPEDTISARARCYLDGWPPKRFCIPGSGGDLPLTTALARSVNSAAVAVAEKVAYPRVIGVARDLGITGTIGDYPAMVLGANEKTMLEMAAAYAAVNNRGVYVRPLPFEEIYGPDGELLWSRRVDAPRPRRALSSDVADALMWMLERVVTAGTGGAASLGDRPVSGKTGTAEGARDLWFIGSIPQVTTAVWFGYDDNYKTGSSSAQAAAAWSAYMRRISKDLPVQQFPRKPVLTGRFQPYVPPKKKGNKPNGSTARLQREQAPPPEEDNTRWEPPTDQATPPDDPQVDRWTPPSLPETPERPPLAAPRWQPPSPPAASAPPPAAAPPPPAPADPVPLSAPPPVMPPPPLP